MRPTLSYSLMLAILSLGFTHAARADDANTAYIVTYIEAAPAAKDQALGLLRQLGKASRKDAGNMRFDALQQSSRPNHLTVVEVWKDMKAVDAHGMADHAKQFREKLLPLSGSLYDERLYKVLN